MEENNLLKFGFNNKTLTSEIIQYYRLNLDFAKNQSEELISFAREKATERDSSNDYFEKHHIIP